MRDYLLGIEHTEIKTEYTSVRDLRDLKEEVAALRIRKQLLTQVQTAINKLQLPSIKVLRQNFEEWQQEEKYPTEDLMVVSEQKLKQHMDFLCDEFSGGMKGDFKSLTASLKVFLSEANTRIAKGTVATNFLNCLI